MIGAGPVELARLVVLGMPAATSKVGNVQRCHAGSRSVCNYVNVVRMSIVYLLILLCM